MRVLEIIFVALVLVSYLKLFIYKSNKKKNIIFLLVTTMVAILSIIFEGYRVHIVPAIMLTVLILACKIVKLFLPNLKSHRTIKLVTLILLLPITIFSVALPFLFPVVNLPKPKGAYYVGTKYLSFTDCSRQEQFSSLDENRTIPVQVWYPTEDTKNKKRVNWISSEAMNFFSKYRGLPNIFNHFSLVKTHSYLNAGISNKAKSYPVILFSCGGAMFNGQNTIQMQELASEGYIVFAVSHPYEDFACLYPNGKIIPYSQKQAAELSSDYKNAINIAKDTVTNKESPEYVKTLIRNAEVNNKSVKIWSKDMQFIINKINDMNSGITDSIFFGKLDMSNIGAFGHSFGGAAVGQLCLDDKRVKTFINMDGSPFGDALNNDILQPFMILTTEKYGEYIRYGYSEKENNYLFVQIKNTEHMNFCDVNSLLPVLGKLTGFLGSINCKQQVDIMNDYIVNFFNKKLKNKTSPLLDYPSTLYPEVKITNY